VGRMSAYATGPAAEDETEGESHRHRLVIGRIILIGCIMTDPKASAQGYFNVN